MDTPLTLCFSTMGDRLADLLPLLNRLKTSKVAILVVIQKWQDAQKLQFKDGEQIRFIWSKEIGLSRSRNLAVANASTDFIWLLDDDVDIKPNQLDELIGILSTNQYKAEILRVRVGCCEDNQAFYKNYTLQEHVSRLDLLRMNSIELIVNRRFVVENNLLFNVNIGLGTAFPGGEEIHFLLDAVEAKGQVKMVHKSYVYHSCLEGGRRKTESDEIMEIRGATASRFGMLGPLLIARWSLRYLMRDKKVSVVFALIKGYLKGYKAYCS